MPTLCACIDAASPGADDDVPPRRRALAVGGGACSLGAVLAGGSGAVGAGGARIDQVHAARQPTQTVPGYGHDPSVVARSHPASRRHKWRAYANSVGHPRASVPIEQLAAIYVQEGAALGVRADIAWAQSIIETGDFAFPDRGQVHPPDNNFAGIGACDSCHSGDRYPSAPALACVHRCSCCCGYADPQPASPTQMIHPPRSYMGYVAPTWRQMGNGRWATSPIYAPSVLRVYALDAAVRARQHRLRSAAAHRRLLAMPVGARRFRVCRTSPPDSRGRRPVPRAAERAGVRRWRRPVLGLRMACNYHGACGCGDRDSRTHAGGYWIFFEDGRVLQLRHRAVVREPRHLGDRVPSHPSTTAWATGRSTWLRSRARLRRGGEGAARRLDRFPPTLQIVDIAAAQQAVAALARRLARARDVRGG